MSEQERKWSAKAMEEDETLKRTIECLRGRLVAERQCSRAAKENADQLDSKLKELENKLKAEIRMRDRAEKKLRLLERKMESLKIAVGSKDSEQQLSSSVSENSLVSCESSITTAVTSGAAKQPREQESDSRIRSGVLPVNLDHNALESAEMKQMDSSSLAGDDHNSGVTEVSGEPCHEVGPDIEVLRPDDHRKIMEEEDDDGVDNSLAIVPVTNVWSEEPQKGEPKITSRSVGEVLEALRLAREGIQRRMRLRQEQKHMIKLGPPQAQAC